MAAPNRSRPTALAVVATLIAATFAPVASAGERAPCPGSIEPFEADDRCETWVARYGARLENGPEGILRGESVNDIALSPDGSRIFATGYARSDKSDPETYGYDYMTLAYSPAGALLWAQRYDVSDHDIARSVDISPDGATLFVTGTAAPTGDSSYRDYVTIAYDAATGASLWTASYDGPAAFSDEPTGIVVGPSGDRVYVGGRVLGLKWWDYAVVAYDATAGTQLWSANYDGPDCPQGSSPDTESVGGLVAGPGPLAADGSRSERVYITGTSEACILGSDLATVAYDGATGTQVWAARYHKGPADGAAGIELDPSGDKLYVTGVESAGTALDYVTVAYGTATGQQLWAASYDGGVAGNANDRARAVTTAPDGGRIFVTGTSEVSRDPLIGPFIDCIDYLTVAYDADTGTRLWTARTDGSGGTAIGCEYTDVPHDIATGPAGDRVYVTGGTSSPKSLSDPTTVAFDAASGARSWLARYSDALSTGGLFVAVVTGPDGKVYAGGSAGRLPELSADLVVAAYEP